MLTTNSFASLVLACACSAIVTFALQAHDTAGGPTNDSKKLVIDELTAKRINVISDDGRARIVLSNPERFPNPRLNGKEYPRSIRPAGVVFYRSNGDECGGIALAEVPGARKNMLIFDYTNTDGIGIGAYETERGGYGGGITIADRLPLDADIEKVGSEGVQRVSVSNDDGVAQVLLSDGAGKPRIRMCVDKAGEARIEVLDRDGKVTFHAP